MPNRKQPELTTGEIFNLIDQISASGVQRLGIWGGEPLLRDDIGDVINYAKAKDLYVTLDTNGYLVSNKLMLLKNLDNLIMSLDGDEKSHDLNRGKGSFRRTYEALKIASKVIPTWTITVLTKNNLEAIDFIIAEAKKLGFLCTFQLLHHNDALSINYKNLLPSNEEYRKAIKKLINYKKKGAPIASSSNYLNYLLRWPDYSMPTSEDIHDRLCCWAGKFYCNVDTDGTVYPCSLMIGKIKAKNFLESGFKDAFGYIGDTPCKSCIASCFIEYNYLYSFNLRSIAEWITAVSKRP